jgi:hypothetical protein
MNIIQIDTCTFTKQECTITVPPAVVAFIELYDIKTAVPHFCGFPPKLGFFAGFSLYIINFAGRISEAAMGGAEARSALFWAHKKTVVRNARRRMRGKNSLVLE